MMVPTYAMLGHPFHLFFLLRFSFHLVGNVTKILLRRHALPLTLLDAKVCGTGLLASLVDLAGLACF